MNEEILTNDPSKALKPSERVIKIIKLKALKKKLEIAIKEHEQAILQVMESSDVRKLETGDWILTRFPVTRTKVVNHALAITALKAMSVPVETQEVLHECMASVYKKMIEEGKEIDGIESSTSYQLRTTARKEK
jgi:hypothetical protein